MSPAAASTIEVVVPPVEAEEPLMSEKVQTLKVTELKVGIQQRALSNNGNKAVLCNQLLEAVVNNLPIFNAGGEGNKAGGTQVAFTNPEDGRIPGLRWKELRLNKDPSEEITEAGFCAPTTQEDCRVPPQRSTIFLRFLIAVYLQKNCL